MLVDFVFRVRLSVNFPNFHAQLIFQIAHFIVTAYRSNNGIDFYIRTSARDNAYARLPVNAVSLIFFSVLYGHDY